MLDQGGHSDEDATDTGSRTRPQEENVVTTTNEQTTTTNNNENNATNAPSSRSASFSSSQGGGGASVTGIATTTTTTTTTVSNTGSAPESRTTTPTPPTQQQQQIRLQVVDGNEARQQQQQDTSNNNNLSALARSPGAAAAAVSATADDNSRYQFMSEPSVSEEGSDRIIAAHRLPAGPNAFRRPSLENNERGGGQYYHRSFHGSVPNSPGNTSLSSWDTSPARPNVQLHFASSLKQGPSLPPVIVEDRNGERRVRVQHQQQPADFPLLPRTDSGVQHHLLHGNPNLSHTNDNNNNISNHVDDLEHASLGLPSLSVTNNRSGERNVSNSSGGDSSDAVGVPRNVPERIPNNNDSTNNDNNNNFYHVLGMSQEASINMALSESEDETGGGDFENMTEKTVHTVTSEEPLLDWEAQQDHTADDERTRNSSSQAKNNNHTSSQLTSPPSRQKIPRTHHRRTRSGDAAAASLATGGVDWKGMAKDNIPIPESGDDTDDSRSPVRTNKKQSLKHTEKHSPASAWSQPQNTKNAEQPSFQQNLERTISQQNHRLNSLSPCQSLQQQSSESSLERQRSPKHNNSNMQSQQRQQEQQSPQGYTDQPGFAGFQSHGQQRMAYAMNYSGTMPPPPPSLAQMYAGSPMMGSQRHMPESLQGMNNNAIMNNNNGRPSMLQIPSSPRMGGGGYPSPMNNNRGYPQMQPQPPPPPPPPPPPQEMNPHMQGPMSVPYITAWCPPSPGYYAEPSPLHYPPDSVASFSPYNSMRKGSDASFPFVETVNEDDESAYSDDDRPMSISDRRMHFDPDMSAGSNKSVRQVEQLYEDPDYRGSYQNNVARSHLVPGSESPFANLGKKSVDKASRSTFMPNLMSEADMQNFPTYICPRCKTRQREFFTVSDAPRALAEPSNYLAFYFGIYVIASLFIFGLEEGWKPLDCVYFAVITLTTAGLGDYVPTTDANKIICSIFIYFGVACIGLLLGSYIANMLDDRAYRDAKRKQIDNCPNCERLMNAKALLENPLASGNITASGISNGSRPGMMKAPIHLSMRNIGQNEDSHNAIYVPRHRQQKNERSQQHASPRTPHNSENLTANHDMPTIIESTRMNTGEMDDSGVSPSIPSPPSGVPAKGPPASPNVFGSPLTRQILGRQKHTRHQSFDVSGAHWNPKQRKFSVDVPSTLTTPTINEGIPMNPPNSAPNAAPQIPFNSEGQGTHSLRGAAFVFDGANDDEGNDDESNYEDDDYSYDSTESSASAIDDFVDESATKIKAAKYVFLTLKQALVNSLVIIAVGCVGFVLTEEFNIVDSWYFTTVLLTTVGYGDIVPITNGGKLFATVYILVAGTVLINNMSMISMIPLELRRRRIERAVLTQFGDMLDDAALRELATGPLIQRLSLHSSRADGLAECTREMFSLAMLVRLGKVTEEDICETFAVFRRLDVNDEGVLNSKSIIAGMIQKHRNTTSSRHSSARVRQRRRANESSMNNAGLIRPYWPVLPNTATPQAQVFDQDGPMTLLPEQPLRAALQQPVLQPYAFPPPEVYGSSLPNERTSLLTRERTNSG